MDIRVSANNDNNTIGYGEHRSSHFLRRLIMLKNTTRHLLILSALAALTACDISPVKNPPPAADPIIVSGVADIKVNQANLLYQQGKKREAAEAYFQAGNASPSPQRERLILQAAEAASMLPDKNLMSRYVRAINTQQLNRNTSARYDYVKGLILMLEGRFALALDILPKNTHGITKALANKIRITRLRAADKSGNPLLIVKERDAQHVLLTNARNQKSNRTEIWRNVQQLSLNAINAERRTSKQSLRGWFDLAYIKLSSTGDHNKLTSNIALWQKNFPSHPGTIFAQELMGNPATLQTNSTPSNVSLNSSKPTAVLLPFSGNMSNIGNSIYRGIVDAHKRHPNAPALRKYDTSTADATVLYNQATKEDSGFVLGPFSKSNLTSVSRNGYLNIPVLGLNYLPSGQHRPDNLLQFGLLPEDEAVQIAQLLSNQSSKRVAILVPDSAWGQRLEQAFTENFTQRGGQIVTTLRYTNRATGYTSVISSFMRDIKGNVDAIFLAASPTQARLIFPVTKSIEDIAIPVYATSHIFSGRPFPTMDNSLNGILYTEIPWILKNANSIPDTLRYPRLYALGLDAFTISKKLSSLQRGNTLKGNTGTLRFSEDGSLHRTLSIATFADGKPTLVAK
ncbi:MAG: LppC putative lipoprotein [uncultured Thiotrichaceae bacterium]|uniref:LppC putative lipoprotein n=1 Tax=uncultured Thiotrichaceae bacterium TaxID=298394 RepID=A0A6S6SR83_9GAMM|nr:MAG: LppC putative lipoprotein [uncultured Thiotrichaceae bacterium]